MSVGTLVIKPVTRPASLAGHTNGKLPEHLLVKVGPSGYLHPVAARAFFALQFYCMSVGLPLVYTYGGCYRPYANQETLFRSRYAVGGAYGGCKTWLKQLWCKILVNGRVPAGAAVPGTSNHGWGLAIDTAFDLDLSDGIGPDDAAAITGHPQWLMFKKFVLDCGFSWEDPSEPWHIRFVMGDVVPQAILDVENFIAAINAGTLPPAPPEPKPVPVPPTSTWMETVVRQLPNLSPGARDTDNDSDVKRLQALLVAAGYSLVIDGIFGVNGQTFKALSNFQYLRGGKAGGAGICDQRTWTALLGA